jgi:hypothetical protein
VRVMGEAVDHWQRYRDEVAMACGIRRDGRGEPVLAA